MLLGAQDRRQPPGHEGHLAAPVRGAAEDDARDAGDECAQGRIARGEGLHDDLLHHEPAHAVGDENDRPVAQVPGRELVPQIHCPILDRQAIRTEPRHHARLIPQRPHPAVRQFISQLLRPEKACLPILPGAVRATAEAVDENHVCRAIFAIGIRDGVEAFGVGDHASGSPGPCGGDPNPFCLGKFAT